MLDIRIPIGLLFTVFGVIITIFGFVTINDTEMYNKSLHINVNIYMGIIILVFGAGMLLWSRFNKSK
jgi:uncharacterized protein YhhL (DUF1145 family)